MVANGNVPTSQLRQVEGWAWLAPGAADAWQLFAFKVYQATGRRPTITAPDGAYRSFARQVYWRARKGAGAAVPGKSNHGLGLAVDIGNYLAYSHATLAAIARACGFTFDVANEAWHIHYLGSPNYGASSPAAVTVVHLNQEEDEMRWFAVRDANLKTLLGVTVGATTYTEVNPDTDPVEYALERDLYSYPGPIRFITPEQWRITRVQIDKRRAQSKA